MPTRMTIDECIALLERMRDIYGDNVYVCEKLVFSTP